MKYNGSKKPRSFTQKEEFHQNLKIRVHETDLGKESNKEISKSGKEIAIYIKKQFTLGVTSGFIGRNTVLNILRNKPVERKSLQIFCDAFGIELTEKDLIPNNPDEDVDKNIPSSGMLVEPDSKWYVSNKRLEEDCLSELLDLSPDGKVGSLVRVRAPNKMGKTSFLRRIEYLLSQYSADLSQVHLSLAEVDNSILKNSGKFYRWLCASITNELSLESKIDSYWDKDLGNKSSFSNYIEKYVLKEVDLPLFLFLDDVDLLLRYSEIAKDFFVLLRFWHEKKDFYSKLRIVISYNTFAYIKFDPVNSPFNVGHRVDIPYFTQEQINRIASECQLKWTEEDISNLFKLVAGHPYLVRLAFYQVVSQKVDIKKVIDNGANEDGLYASYLSKIKKELESMDDSFELFESLKLLVSNASPVELNVDLNFPLLRLGLINLSGNKASVKCELYRQYFSRILLKNV